MLRNLLLKYLPLINTVIKNISLKYTEIKYLPLLI